MPCKGDDGDTQGSPRDEGAESGGHGELLWTEADVLGKARRHTTSRLPPLSSLEAVPVELDLHKKRMRRKGMAGLGPVLRAASGCCAAFQRAEQRRSLRRRG